MDSPRLRSIEATSKLAIVNGVVGTMTSSLAKLDSSPGKTAWAEFRGGGVAKVPVETSGLAGPIVRTEEHRLIAYGGQYY